MAMQVMRIGVRFGKPRGGVHQGDPELVEIRTCNECGRVRAFAWHSYAEIRNRIRCPCGHKRNTLQKQQMLFIDRLEALLPAIPLKDAVLWHLPMGSYGSEITDSYGAVGRVPRTYQWVYYDMGRFPLGDDTPTWVYLIAFPNWHGERFVKVGIGLDQRLRDHEAQGGVVLQKVKVPRWQARVIERLVLRQHLRQRPSVPLPQYGDTECLAWEAAAKIKLSALASMTAGARPESTANLPHST
ncbi:hypothetical protein ACPEIC_36390 [Stenotrophomonas sp. NPDC087984]